VDLPSTKESDINVDLLLGMQNWRKGIFFKMTGPQLKDLTSDSQKSIYKTLYAQDFDSVKYPDTDTTDIEGSDVTASTVDDINW